jgi:hypothetical protein
MQTYGMIKNIVVQPDTRIKQWKVPARNKKGETGEERRGWRLFIY